MLTFSLNQGNDILNQEKLLADIQSLRPFFIQHNGVNAEEAMHRAFVFACGHNNDSYESKIPYLKKLAKTIMLDRQSKKEITTSLSNEDGSETACFVTLQESMPEYTDDLVDALFAELCDLYLLRPAEMAWFCNKIVDGEVEPKEVITDIELRNRLDLLYKMNGLSVFLKASRRLAKHLLSESLRVPSKTSKRLEIAPIDSRAMTLLCDNDLVLDPNGDLHGFDRRTFLSEYPVDSKIWSCALPAKQVFRVDISSVVNYACEKLLADKGVSNELVTCFRGRSKLTSLGGTVLMNVDRETFVFNTVFKEIIGSFVMNKQIVVVATSLDNVYFYFKRSCSFGSILLASDVGRDFVLHLEKVNFKGVNKDGKV